VAGAAVASAAAGAVVAWAAGVVLGCAPHAASANARHDKNQRYDQHFALHGLLLFNTNNVGTTINSTSNGVTCG